MPEMLSLAGTWSLMDDGIPPLGFLRVRCRNAKIKNCEKQQNLIVSRAQCVKMDPIIVNLGCARGGMADTPDLGSGSARIGGSSPLARTIQYFADFRRKAMEAYSE